MKVTIELSNDSLAALADALAVRLKDVPKPAETPAQGGFVTRTEAARMGVERKALLRAERSGRLEAFRPGRVVVYRRRDIEALVESHKVSLVPGATALPGSGVLPTDPFDQAVRNAAHRRSRRG
jgi:hypothetical protein